MDQSLQQYGGTTLFNNRQLNTNYTKYWDKYEVGIIEKTVTEKDGVYRNHAIWDATYSDATNGNSKRKSITDERYNLMKNKLGDAMHEVMGTEYSYYGKTKSNGYAWVKTLEPTVDEYGTGFYNKDFALIGNCAKTFVLRGGYWNDEWRTGVLAFVDDTGYPNHAHAFRPVLVV